MNSRGVTREKEKMILVSFHVPRSYVETLDDLVKMGLYPSRSEAIRAALRELLSKYSDMAK
ncbi:ribbon-helix-helix domain-containing protein [Pyrobaculum arsenaticum]|uniref:Putative transcriptional regulator, CopG/Arc/MetJ family n=1 Tax=Pyrobaculum arsenaticum (strain DSM 13514 / JCM 11321 / PZ6) TaxID=340102 RepID=A4WIP2_PYRAR|nr:ribbon-helix-helix domain-containing protein [Pyrobaculum arsenaticum]ABP50259.1 putative transcriptional regulator, CopG/Arc/MetJ family [Pyrobaculum arsenaticum DSM 13514]